MLKKSSLGAHPLTRVFVGSVALTTPRDVHACGGCFAPPGGAQVVTDHRMVLSLSTTQTTL
jgi:hypothetical protein